MKQEHKNSIRAICFVLVLIGIFWWANQPVEPAGQSYTLPPIEGKVKGYNYQEHHWDYTGENKQRVYTQRQVDSIRRYAKNMKADEFEDLMEDYIDEQESWEP